MNNFNTFFQAGMVAKSQGANQTDCPYPNHTPGWRQKRQDWLDGWLYQEKAISDQKPEPVPEEAETSAIDDPETET